MKILDSLKCNDSEKRIYLLSFMSSSLFVESRIKERKHAILRNEKDDFPIPSRFIIEVTSQMVLTSTIINLH